MPSVVFCLAWRGGGRCGFLIGPGLSWVPDRAGDPCAVPGRLFCLLRGSLQRVTVSGSSPGFFSEAVVIPSGISSGRSCRSDGSGYSFGLSACGGHGARSVLSCVRLAAFPCVANCDGMKRNRNKCFEAFRLWLWAEMSLLDRLARFWYRKFASRSQAFTEILSFAKVPQQIRVRAYTKSHWQKTEIEKPRDPNGLAKVGLTVQKKRETLIARPTENSAAEWS